MLLPTWHQSHVLFLMVSWFSAEKQLTCGQELMTLGLAQMLSSALEGGGQEGRQGVRTSPAQIPPTLGMGSSSRSRS